jgi:hypothetical protein
VSTAGSTSTLAKTLALLSAINSETNVCQNYLFSYVSDQGHALIKWNKCVLVAVLAFGGSVSAQNRIQFESAVVSVFNFGNTCDD